MCVFSASTGTIHSARAACVWVWVWVWACGCVGEREARSICEVSLNMRRNTMMQQPTSPCELDPTHLASTRAVMLATVQGRDGGAVVVAHLMNSMSGFRVKNFAAGDKWVHLAEFGQRWLTMREKMTNPAHEDHAHFSQFIASPNDGIAPTSQDTDFRAMDELIRRKIKPAWYHFFNSSKLVCGLRQVVIEAVNPAHHPVFGFVTAFDTSGRVSVDKVEDSPSRRTYSAGRALRSIDLFLRVFPHGKVILHLPVDSLPPDGGPPPRCVCPGERVACKQRGTAWPDRRLRLMRELTRYHELQRERTILTSASGDFRNMTRLASRLSSFLGNSCVQTSTMKPTARFVAGRADCDATSCSTSRSRSICQLSGQRMRTRSPGAH